MNPNQLHTQNQNIEGLFLNGCAYRIEGDRVIITINEIQNQREFNQTSGTLSIELWALRQPHQGGQFDGIAVAGTQIGEVLGQHFLANCQYDLIFQAPPAGTWYLTLMLREWTEAGFQTRDFVNFDLPYVVTWTPSVVQGNPDNVINVSFAETEDEKEEQNTSAEVKEKVSTASEIKVENRAELEEKEAKAEIKTKVESVKPAASVAPAESAKPAASKPAISKPAPAKPVKVEAEKAQGVSINEASVDEIAAIKGVSKKLAVKIVESRPFENLEQLVKVRGMGEKLLKRIRKEITL